MRMYEPRGFAFMAGNPYPGLPGPLGSQGHGRPLGPS